MYKIRALEITEGKPHKLRTYFVQNICSCGNLDYYEVNPDEGEDDEVRMLRCTKCKTWFDFSKIATKDSDITVYRLRTMDEMQEYLKMLENYHEELINKKYNINKN